MLRLCYFKCNNCGYIFEQSMREDMSSFAHCPKCKTPSVEIPLEKYLRYTGVDE